MGCAATKAVSTKNDSTNEFWDQNRTNNQTFTIENLTSNKQPRQSVRPLRHSLDEEERRLQILEECQVWHTLPEHDYDAITTVLQRVLRVRIAVVGLLGKGELFCKSVQGMEPCLGEHLKPFCNINVRGAKPTMLIVPDTRLDVRFKDNHVVAGPPRVRFYAGAPLISSDGCVLGMLAVMDTVPRNMVAEMANCLCNFAELVARELERSRVAVLRQRVEDCAIPIVRALACLTEPVALCDVEKSGWPLLYANRQWCEALGVTDQQCLRGGIWNFFRFGAASHAAQMLYAHAAIEEHGPFALGVIAGTTNGSSKASVLLNFRPATNDYLGEHTPHTAIPSFLALGRRSHEPTDVPFNLHFVILERRQQTSSTTVQQSSSTASQQATAAQQRHAAEQAAVAGSLQRGISEGAVQCVSSGSGFRQATQRVSPSPPASGSPSASARLSDGFSHTGRSSREPVLQLRPAAVADHLAFMSARLRDSGNTEGSGNGTLARSSHNSAMSFKPWNPRSFGQEPPEVLSEVFLGPLIGSGSHGRVFRGFWKETTVAVKILDCWLEAGQDIGDAQVTGPWLEAVLSKDLQHPAIVNTFMYAVQKHQEQGDSPTEADSGAKVHQELWIVQEFCNRGTLNDAIDGGWLRQGRAPDAPPDMQALLLTAQDIAAAIGFMHDLNVLHGDLAGNNVLLTASDADARGFSAKVSDFGLARVITSRTCRDGGLGTISHMPPEMIEHYLLTKAADVYCFGVLLWEMYCGAHAWAGYRLPQIVHAKIVLKERLRLPEACPPSFRALVEACMEHDHRSRPSFAAIRIAIAGMLGALATGN